MKNGEMLYNGEIQGTRSRNIMETKARRRIILLSILLHALFLASWESTFKLGLSRRLPPPPPQGAPLVLDLEAPSPAREVVATPEDARTDAPPSRADLLSDKNARARNAEPAPGVRPGDEPYARGDVASHELPPLPAAPRSEAAAGSDDQTEPTDPQRPGAEAEGTSPIQQKPDRGRNNLPLPRPGAAHDQRDTRVLDTGGMSFNTYNWDFAPYMLELKERIRRNIFPPIAFSQLGMIDGDTLLRFKIFPNGELRDLELLAYDGHRSLMETSTLAVKVSAPFRKLPDDFPEPYLEVTARFSYTVTNKRG
jgi:hypothetical protein